MGERNGKAQVIEAKKGAYGPRPEWGGWGELEVGRGKTWQYFYVKKQIGENSPKKKTS